MSLFLSRTARARHGLGEAFGVSGRIGLPTFYQARVLALELVTHAGDLARGVSAGRLNALSELERLFRKIAVEVLAVEDSERLRGLLRVLIERFGRNAVDRLLSDFAREFMAFALEPGWTERLDSAEGETVVIRAGEVLRELVVLAWVHRIPEASGVQELLHEGPVVEAPIFEAVAAAVEAWVEPPPAGVASSPVAAVASLAEEPALRGQLERAVELWPELSSAEPPGFVAALDLIEEEERPRFAHDAGPRPIELPAYTHLEDTPARFSVDEPWMAGAALVAKNTFVWFDQLARRYGRPIRRLDEVPDAELEALAEDGVDTLWLIGVWERSAASQRVKQLCGNPDAVASAYSLRSYRIAEELGGPSALVALERRAQRFGLRLAADMVPNHLGIDSDWIYEHPERFLSVPVPPFPSYTFAGPNLSDRRGIEVRLEDHYYDRTDAAVVFERKNAETREAHYIYHGNDGTTTPWNDTAQLDYSKTAVREAVIEEILSVAEHFPVLRFDAAMTLAKTHVQRLWFPLPGEAGAIPSRAEHAMTQEIFDSVMPEEFWREVVARVVAERPGTMILAEAFWLMESYFVRSLGVHRVYNSAFMNLLRDGRDRKYRDLIKETVRFDSRILERYVNFMTNPDEPSARKQFGTGDRYFGVATLLATLPGTPLWGHGQFEGLGEKYGMEFRRPLLDEPIDRALVAEHRRRIAPFLADRRLFAGSTHFRLFDFTAGDRVVEMVYAYTNRDRGRAAIVLFNHSERPVAGRLTRSAPTRPQGVGTAQTETIVQALALASAPEDFWLFRDAISGESFLRSTESLRREGLELRLKPFESKVLVDFRNVGADRTGSLRAQAAAAGRWGGRQVEAEVLAPRAVPAARTLRSLLKPQRLARLLSDRLTPAGAGAGAWARDIERLRAQLVEAGFLPQGGVTQTLPGTTLLNALRGLKGSFAALPWPPSDRLEAARDRWVAGSTPDRLARLAGRHLLAEVARWGDGAARFLAITRAGRALGAPPLRAMALGESAGESGLKPELPPGLEELRRLAVLGLRSATELDELLWWETAIAASLWFEPIRTAAFDARSRRRCANERAEDVVVGWVDALERLREEQARTGGSTH